MLLLPQAARDRAQPVNTCHSERWLNKKADSLEADLHLGDINARPAGVWVCQAWLAVRRSCQELQFERGSPLDALLVLAKEDLVILVVRLQSAVHDLHLPAS